MNRISFLYLIVIWVVIFVFPPLLSAKVMDTRDIELRTKANNEDLRSLLPVRAWVDNRIVYVSFLGLPEKINISIFDEEGNLIEVYNSQLSQMVSISLEGKYGRFQIEIDCDLDLFIGYFQVE